MGGAPDAKDFVGESLAHLHDPSKIDDHFSKSVETARDAARFRTRYEAVASSKKLHDDACFRELEIGSVLVEDLSKRARRLQARLETNAGAASARSRPHGHVTYSIVHDPAQPTTVDLEPIRDLRREKNTLARVPLGQRREFALAELFQRVEIRR